MSPTSAVLEPRLDARRVTRAAQLRVLALVEARGITGALRNLFDFAGAAARQSPSITFELATYWRSAAPGRPGSTTRDIQDVIDAAAGRGIYTHVLHERFAGDPRLLAQVRVLLRETPADIVETHHVKSHALVASSLAPDARAAWVAFHHGYTTTTLKTRLLNLLDVWSLTRPDAVVTPCQAFARQLRRRGVDPSRITVIHSSVGRAPRVVTEDIRVSLGVRPSTRIVLAVGRLSREKGHARLIDAFTCAPLARLRDAILVIAGDGPERDRLARRAGRAAAGRVHFVGHRSNVWPFYQAADVVALASDTEGSPIALLEAMAAGRPVVATAVGGVPEIVEHGWNGIRVPPRDTRALSHAISGLLQDPARAAALGSRALRTTQDRFTVDVRAAALSAVYQRVCAR